MELGEKAYVFHLDQMLYRCRPELPVSIFPGGFPGSSVVKNPPPMQETQVPSLGLENPLEKELAIHSSILA